MNSTTAPGHDAREILRVADVERHHHRVHQARRSSRATRRSLRRQGPRASPCRLTVYSLSRRATSCQGTCNDAGPKAAEQACIRMCILTAHHDASKRQPASAAAACTRSSISRISIDLVLGRRWQSAAACCWPATRSRRRRSRAALPRPMCCCSGDAPNDAAAVHRAVDRAPAPAGILDRHRDARADGGAVASSRPRASAPSQSLPWPGFSNRRNACASPGVAPPTLKTISSSPSLSRSAKATPWPLCSSPVPGRVGDVHERLAVPVAQQHARHERAVRRAAGAEIDVEEAVVVDVAEVRPHRHEHLGQSGLARHVRESCRRPGCGRASSCCALCGRPQYDRAFPRPTGSSC